MHALVTIAIPFDPKRADAVEAELDKLGNPPNDAIAAALDEAAFVHFISITVVPADPETHAHLLIEFSADGGATASVRQLSTTLGTAIETLLAAAQVERSGALAEFLLDRRINLGQGWFAPSGLNYDGTPGMSVVRIRREAALAEYAAWLLDRHAPAGPALEALRHIRSALWEEGSWKWAFVPEPAPILPAGDETVEPAASLQSTFARLLPPLPSLLAAFTASFLWPFLLLALVVLILGWSFIGVKAGIWAAVAVIVLELAAGGNAYSRLRRLEETDVPDDVPPDAARVADIMRRESFAAQNHMAAISILKPGRLRRLTLRIGLWTAGQLAIHFSQPSFLAETGVIHFARWVLLPGTDKLLFFSNYDGAWETYLEDFIEKASQGVTGIWSNTAGFPRTSNLFNQGASDGNRLRRWTRRQQHPTRFWYTAYPALTLTRIRRNAAIRRGIAGARTEAEAADWLSCFGSSPRPPDRIEAEEVPTLVFGGLRRLAHARCLFLVLDDDRAKIQAWLRQIEQQMSYGDGSATPSASLLGLKQTALKKLGLDRALASFPPAYQHGSAAPWRARALGDMDADGPEHWLWGGSRSEVDAVMLLYDADSGRLAERTAALRRQLDEHGHSVRREIELKPVPQGREPVHEPFGFVDGVSDPVIRGVGKWMLQKYQNHLVEPGEIILGYTDNSGTLPCSPVVAATDDPAGILPALVTDAFGERLDFETPQPTVRRDLGGNGTFLVIRQLEQDVDAFDAFCKEGAEHLSQRRAPPPGNRAGTAEWVAAKMVGRWKNGDSLVRYPHGPDGRSEPDNDFLFGVEDPDGMRCPFGAHIRRANARDTLAPGSEIQLRITNRHRILRVGRSYLPQEDLTKPGLIFMCLNSDIERQFEFVQQSWILGRSFGGLENEVDPMLGRGAAQHVLTIPTPNGPLRLKRMKDFVRVRGSGYFFLPGRRAMHFLARCPSEEAP